MLLGLLVASVCGLPTSGCTFVDMASIGPLGIDAATTVAEQRSFYSSAEDYSIQSEISNQFSDESLFLQVSTDVYQRLVLLTGAVKDIEARQRAEVLAQGVKGSRSVINEIVVTQDVDLNAIINDLFLEKKLKLDLLLMKEVHSINYRWRVVNGTVYLLGLAQDQQELTEVIALARSMPGIRHVVSYAEIKE